MSHFGNIGHHLIVAIIDHIPNGWVMFNGDMTNDPCFFFAQSTRWILVVQCSEEGSRADGDFLRGCSA